MLSRIFRIMALKIMILFGWMESIYSLTLEEVEALVTGDVEKIRSWVSNLDKRQAAWLLHQLIDEIW